METLANRDGIVAKFVQKNIEAVRRQVDSRIVTDMVKNLVRDVAMHE
jgi:hypothetical protein